MYNKVLCLWIDFTYLEKDQLLGLLTTDDNKKSSQYLLSIVPGAVSEGL